VNIGLAAQEQEAPKACPMEDIAPFFQQDFGADEGAIKWGPVAGAQERNVERPGGQEVVGGSQDPGIHVTAFLDVEEVGEWCLAHRWGSFVSGPLA